MNAHEQAVAEISATIKKFYARNEAFRIYHGSTNSTRKSQYQRDQMVDISGLNHVLKIDTAARTALVEPNVPMDVLVEATMKHGLVPPVVMEFPGITVGGGFAGTAGESSSFRYGFFDRTINWIKIVLGNGEVVKASNTEKPDLFYGAASSFGTLGVTTLLEIRLIEAKTYVATTYIPVSGIKQAQEELEKATKDETVDYVDGIIYSLEQGIICVGRLTNELPRSNVKVQRFTRPMDPWFYMHVQRLPHKITEPIIEAIPLVDYLFRYDRGGFWVARYAYTYFLTPFNRITRFLLNPFMHTRVMYHALHASGLSSSYIIQDVAIPYPKSSEFMAYLASNFAHYPIWLCPLRLSRNDASTHDLNGDVGLSVRRNGEGEEGEEEGLPEMMLNFGVWGPGPRDRLHFVDWNRDFEHKVSSLGGRKWLYAHTYYTESEFDAIYPRPSYDALREKYHASHLPSVYSKVSIDLAAEQRAIHASWSTYIIHQCWSVWPFAGLWGVWCAMRGGDYLLPRNGKGKSVAGSKDVKKTV